MQRELASNLSTLQSHRFARGKNLRSGPDMKMHPRRPPRLWKRTHPFALIAVVIVVDVLLAASIFQTWL